MLDMQDDSELVQNYDQTNAQILNNMQTMQNMDHTNAIPKYATDAKEWVNRW